MVKNPVESKDGAACIARAYEESVLPGHIISGPGQCMYACTSLFFFFWGRESMCITRVMSLKDPTERVCALDACSMA